MKAGIVVDNHKLESFRRNLKHAGFEWKESPFTKNVTTMMVEYAPDELEVLTAIARTASSQVKGKS